VRARWLWIASLALYAGFFFWYQNLRGPLTPAEIDDAIARLSTPDRDPAQLATLRAFLEADDGGEFFMVNLIRMHPGDVAEPGTGATRPASKVLEGYTGPFMRALFLRAGHIALGGRAAGRYVEQWGVEPDPGWSFAGVIRYRSRRDMLALVTDPAFEPAHVYKLAAMANTLAFPIAPAFQFAGPRVWVALALALVAALGHVALGARSRRTAR
jgi:hypothetical protein